MTTEQKLKVWVSPYQMQYADKEVLKDPHRIGEVALLSYQDHSSGGYTLFGEATIAVTLFSQEEVVKNAIVALNAEAAEIRAAATKKCTEIEGKIQQLLAIENGVK